MNHRTANRLDLTEGPILKTLVRLAVPVTISMVLFTVYLLVDLYFVGRLGPDAVAALSISSNAFFIHWGIQSVWWIKLATAAAETAVVAIWLKRELSQVRANFAINRQPAELQSV